jgi:ferredoxin-NADP reductase
VTQTESFAAVVGQADVLGDGIRLLRLMERTGKALPSWEPGAHIDVGVPGGAERQYSLCGQPGAPYWEIAVQREANGRGGSRFLCDTVRAGDQLAVRGPRNHFPLITAETYLYIAGGIGVTPLLPMAEQCGRDGRPVRFLYGARTRHSMAFLERLGQSGAELVLWPQDTKGFPPIGEEIRNMVPQAAVYCCGPSPMLAAVESACRAAGRQPPLLERFAPDAGALTDGETAAFEIELASSGEVLSVPPDKSILQVLDERGYDTDASCEEGICGTCETAVLSGVPIHRDSVLTDADHQRGDCMMICVSRAAAGTRLLLDR